MVGNQEKNKVFTGIYRHYFPRLLRFARFYVLSAEDAENIIQDIFAYLWEHLEILDPVKNRDAFLFTLIKNKCIDHLRDQLAQSNKSEKLQDIIGKEYELKLYSLQQLEEASLSIKDIEQLVEDAVNKLPERCREIFLLKRSEGLKNREIADRLGISVNTVENQMTIAIRKLKAELKDHIPILLFFI